MDIFFFFYIKVCCLFLLELPHRDDSNEYTQHTIFNMNEASQAIQFPRTVSFFLLVSLCCMDTHLLMYLLRVL